LRAKSPQGDINLDGNYLVINSADPTLSHHLTNKKYVDDKISNIKISPSIINGYPNDTTKFLRGDGQWQTPPKNESGSIVGDIKQSIKTQDHNGWLKWRQGRVLSRITYAALWAEVLSSGLVSTGMFGNGDGVTNFTMELGGSRLLGVASQDTPYTGLRSIYVNPRYPGESDGRENCQEVVNHTHTMNHSHSVSVNNYTHSHSIGHTHSSFNTPSISHSHNLVTFNANNTNSNLDTVVYQYTAQDSSGGYSDYDGSGGASPFKVLYTVGLRNTTSSTSVTYPINIPAFSGTSGSDTHNHTASVSAFSGITGSTGNNSYVNIMNPCLFLNMFIYSGVL
jgi:hypothetical protein